MNRPVSDLPLSDDTDVMVNTSRSIEPHGNGNGHGNGHGQAHAPAAGRLTDPLSQSLAHFQQDAPTCPKCGHVAVRNGACYKCLNCGESLGCS